MAARLDNRTEDRVDRALPVDLGSVKGVTRNVSASGVFFETDAQYAVGSEISFVVDLETTGAKMVLRCRGGIVRVTQGDGKIGVAVKIAESSMVGSAQSSRDSAPRHGGDGVG
jgi:PilZ domain-containing protein